MPGGGSSKQTSSTSTQPWSEAQPALKQSIGAAQNLYSSGVGGQVYTGSTVVPWDSNTLQGMNAITRGATANLNGNGLSGQYQRVINQGGLNDNQVGALNNTKNLANSSWSVSPELQKIIDQTNTDANTNVSMNNSAAGRYGSGMGNSAVADAVSKNTNNLLYTDLNNFQTRKDAANSNLFNMGQTGFGNLGAAYQGMQAPANNLMQVGSMNEDLANRTLQDQLRIFDSQQNLPWQNLARLNGIASGAGSLGGTSTQTQPGQNPFLTALGYGLTGLGALGGI